MRIATLALYGNQKKRKSAILLVSLILIAKHIVGMNHIFSKKNKTPPGTLIPNENEEYLFMNMNKNGNAHKKVRAIV